MAGMWSLHVLATASQEKKLINRAGALDGIYPIPKPDKPPGAIYSTDRPDVSTLQEQMRLEDDPETFSELMVCGDRPSNVRVT